MTGGNASLAAGRRRPVRRADVEYRRRWRWCQTRRSSGLATRTEARNPSYIDVSVRSVAEIPPRCVEENKSGSKRKITAITLANVGHGIKATRLIDIQISRVRTICAGGLPLPLNQRGIERAISKSAE